MPWCGGLSEGEREVVREEIGYRDVPASKNREALASTLFFFSLFTCNQVYKQKITNIIRIIL